MIGISLNQDLSCEHVCKIIQRLVNDYQKDKHSLENVILTIKIAETTEGTLSQETLCIEQH